MLFEDRVLTRTSSSEGTENPRAPLSLSVQKDHGISVGVGGGKNGGKAPS